MSLQSKKITQNRMNSTARLNTKLDLCLVKVYAVSIGNSQLTTDEFNLTLVLD